MNEIKIKIDNLTAELKEYNYNYYVLAKSLITDFEFDIKLKELQDLETEFPQFAHKDSPTKRVGGEVNKDFKTVAHRYLMLSLANTYNEGELRDFDARVSKTIGNNYDYTCELKFDGLSISLSYFDGKLTQALTRGDGSSGDDVTINVKTIKSIPISLRGNDWPKDFEIRGEVVMTRSGFNSFNKTREEAGEQVFANPRNAAAGSLKMKDSAEVAKRPLDCYLYYLLGENQPADNHYDNLMAAKKWGFKVSDFMVKAANVDEILEYINYWDEARKELDFDTDGVVIKVNNIANQQRLGFTAKSPRWAIAYKFKAERVETLLESISYQVGRTGAITPVANLTPIKLAGSIVKRASLHNADIIELLELHEKDFVFVEKGGEIIPKIVGINIEKRVANSQKIKYISHCPECGSALVRTEGDAKHFCPNEYHCPPQIKGKLEHFIGRKMMDIAAGEATVEALFNKGFVRNVADLYDLSAEQLLKLDGFKDKSVENLLLSLEKSKEVSFERLLFSLGIRYVGETVAKKLATYFGNIQALRTASKMELIMVGDIGESIADSMIEYFADPLNIEIIERLIKAGLKFEIEKSESQYENKLDGKSFVVSGKFTIPRDDLKRKISDYGGKNVSAVSAKTDFLIAGENMGPAKLKKAEKLGIEIISEDEFINMIK
ncbi:MAG: DNA ligase (NAD(+)) LigA [Bacteroidetes bacterium CG2_30_33_31]|nr:MAG: DNA ligase (NAD(+)) LigA [Bacteroidetes bacterium CG2_30_33_31]